MGLSMLLWLLFEEILFWRVFWRFDDFRFNTSFFQQCVLKKSPLQFSAGILKNKCCLAARGGKKEHRIHSYIFRLRLDVRQSPTVGRRHV